MRNIRFTKFLLKFDSLSKYFTEEDKNKISDLDNYIKSYPLKVYTLNNKNNSIYNDYIYIGKKNDEYYFYNLSYNFIFRKELEFNFISGRIIKERNISKYKFNDTIMSYK